MERTSAFELRTAEFDRWAEPLEALVPRIVAENLSRSLGTDRVLILPQRRIPEPDFQVELEVLRFDVTTSGQVILEGLWEVYVGREEVPRAVRKSSVGEQVSGPGFPGIAEAMSRALGALSGEIAEAIRNQPGPLR